MLSGTAFAALWVGMRGAEMQEQVIDRRVAAGLEAARIDWARVSVDGLVVRLSGAAPDAFAAELAREIVAGAAGPATVLDTTHRQAREAPARPVSVSLMRDGARVTVTGRLPGAAARARLLARLGRRAPGLEIAALLGTGAAAPQDGLDPAFAVATEAIALLRGARVEIAPGRVSVDGVVPDAGGLRAAAARLRKAAGGGVALTLGLETPPEVIAPFVVALDKAPDGGVLARRCAARSPAEARRLDALLGPGGARCRHGLGGPSGDWPGAVAAVTRALSAAPVGQARLAYREAVLRLPPGTPDAAADRVRAILGSAMPEGYAARLRLAPAQAPPEAERTGRYWLHLTRRPEGAVIAGRMPDRAGVTALSAFAQAGLGAARPEIALARSPEPAPPKWWAAALAAVEALGRLEAGEVALSPGRLRVEGRVGAPAEIGRLHRALAARLPDHALRTRLTVDLPARVAAEPLTPGRCAVLLNALMTRRAVGFAPGSAVIDARAPEALDEAAAILNRCPEARIEVGGHTDSQGPADFNRRLSLARAEAVRAALAERGIARARLVARGFGEAEPVASNATPEGRARNRRIAFRPLETAS